jgi:hypothetical protein
MAVRSVIQGSDEPDQILSQPPLDLNLLAMQVPPGHDLSRSLCPLEGFPDTMTTLYGDQV